MKTLFRTRGGIRSGLFRIFSVSVVIFGIFKISVEGGNFLFDRKKTEIRLIVIFAPLSARMSSEKENIATEASGISNNKFNDREVSEVQSEQIVSVILLNSIKIILKF